MRNRRAWVLGLRWVAILGQKERRAPSAHFLPTDAPSLELEVFDMPICVREREPVDILVELRELLEKVINLVLDAGRSQREGPEAQPKILH